MTCLRCGGCGWVCDIEPTRPWGEVSESPDACAHPHCSANNCPDCNKQGDMPPGTEIIDQVTEH